MTEVIEIIDPASKKIRKVRNLKIVDHSLADENGEVQCVPCVEFIVVGRNHEWPFWATLDDFKKWNSNIEI